MECRRAAAGVWRERGHQRVLEREHFQGGVGNRLFRARVHARPRSRRRASEPRVRWPRNRSRRTRRWTGCPPGGPRPSACGAGRDAGARRRCGRKPSGRARRCPGGRGRAARAASGDLGLGYRLNHYHLGVTGGHEMGQADAAPDRPVRARDRRALSRSSPSKVCAGPLSTRWPDSSTQARLASPRA